MGGRPRLLSRAPGTYGLSSPGSWGTGGFASWPGSVQWVWTGRGVRTATGRREGQSGADEEGPGSVLRVVSLRLPI